MRRPRHRNDDAGLSTPTAAPSVLPDGLTSRQRRLVNTVRFHGQQPDLPCLLVTDYDRDWATIFVAVRADSPTEPTYQRLCRVRESTLRGAFRAGALTHGPLDDWQSRTGVPPGCATPVVLGPALHDVAPA